MEIKILKKEDIPNVAKVMTLAYSEEPYFESWTFERAERRVSAILSNYKAVGFVACEDDCIVGAVLGYVDPLSDRDFFYISELFITPLWKRKGIGRALLDYLSKYLSDENIDVIQLMCLDYNLDFYKKAGLNEDESKVMYKIIR